MIVRDAIRSLKKDFSRSFFYWLTFFLTSMFIFLFFNISMSDEIGVTFINSKSDVSTNVTIMVVILASIDIMFANNFFVKKKAKHLAIMLVSGATYLQLAAYLLIQTVILLLIAIPLGILCALLLIPFINTVLVNQLHSTFLVSVHGEAVVSTAAVLSYVVFWATFLNLSFAYRNSASLMLNESGISLTGGQPFFRIEGFSKKVRKILQAVLFIVPIILIYLNFNMVLVMSALSLAGMVMCLRSFLIPWLNRKLHEEGMEDPLMLASLGFLRSDLQLMKYNYVLLLFASIMLVSFMVTSTNTPLEIMLILLSYIVMNILQSMAVMFRYSTEISGRVKFFRSMEKIGYMENDEAEVIRRETTMFYGFILAVGLFYLLNIFATLLINGQISFAFVLLLLALFILPLLFCYFINSLYYRRAVFE